MRSRLRARALAVVPVGAAVLALSACGTSLTHVRNICRDVTTGTQALAAYDPNVPVTALHYALGRFTLVEKAVATAREAGVPGADGAKLERDWLDAATASMTDWDGRLEALRTAVNQRNPDEVAGRLRDAVAIGTEGVRTDELRAAGLGTCATAFTAPVVPHVG